MRGFPPLHFILFILAFALFAVPLARLTFARPEIVKLEGQTRAPKDEKRTEALVRLRFAHVPSEVSVKLGDHVIIDPGKPLASTTVDVQTQLEIPKDGIEMMVTVTWPANTPDTAVTVEVEPDGLETKTQTHWSTGPTLNQIYSFTW